MPLATGILDAFLWSIKSFEPNQCYYNMVDILPALLSLNSLRGLGTLSHSLDAVALHPRGLKFVDALRDAWPNIFAWIQFFHHEFVRGGGINLRGMMQPEEQFMRIYPLLTHDMAFLLMPSLVRYSLTGAMVVCASAISACRAVLATPGSVELLTELWLNETESLLTITTTFVSPNSIAALQRLLQHVEVHQNGDGGEQIARIIQTAGGRDVVVDRVMRMLRKEAEGEFGHRSGPWINAILAFRLTFPDPAAPDPWSGFPDNVDTDGDSKTSSSSSGTPPRGLRFEFIRAGLIPLLIRTMFIMDALLYNPAIHSHYYPNILRAIKSCLKCLRKILPSSTPLNYEECESDSNSDSSSSFSLAEPITARGLIHQALDAGLIPACLLFANHLAPTGVAGTPQTKRYHGPNSPLDTILATGHEGEEIYTLIKNVLESIVPTYVGVFPSLQRAVARWVSVDEWDPLVGDADRMRIIEVPVKGAVVDREVEARIREQEVRLRKRRAHEGVEVRPYDVFDEVNPMVVRLRSDEAVHIWTNLREMLMGNRHGAGTGNKVMLGRMASSRQRKERRREKMLGEGGCDNLFVSTRFS